MPKQHEDRTFLPVSVIRYWNKYFKFWGCTCMIHNLFILHFLFSFFWFRITNRVKKIAFWVAFCSNL